MSTGFSPIALAVEAQGDRVGVGHRHDLDRLAFPARPIPVGNQLQNRAVLDPVRLVDVERGLGKSAQIHAAERRSGRRPAQRLRFAVIVEAGPDETARHERPLGDPFPGLAMRQAPRLGLRVVGIEDAALAVGRVFAAGHDRRRVFGTGDRLGRVGLVVGVVDAWLVVEAGHVGSLRRIPLVHHRAALRGGDRPRGVELFHHRGHLADHFVTLACCPASALR